MQGELRRRIACGEELDAGSLAAVRRIRCYPDPEDPQSLVTFGMAGRIRRASGESYAHYLRWRSRRSDKSGIPA